VLNQQQRLQTARRAQENALQLAILAGNVDAPMKLVILENEIEEASYQDTVDLPIKMDELENTHYDNKWRTFQERNIRLEK
jgi:multidrug efflux pump subunit AcrA (membrane-fusion protein)